MRPGYLARLRQKPVEPTMPKKPQNDEILTGPLTLVLLDMTWSERAYWIQVP